MVIRTECIETIEEDIAEIFDAVPEYIREQVLQFDEQCPTTDEDIFNDLLDGFIENNAAYETIDGIQVYHLAVCNSNMETLQPLDITLTNASSIQQLLFENGIVIKKEHGTTLGIWHKGKRIREEYIKAQSPLLARRLGTLGVADYCVNGFSFWATIKQDSEGYYDRLKQGPEFLQYLDELLRTTVATQYRELGVYCGLMFEIPINRAIFDRCEGASCQEKAKLLVRNALKILLGYYKGFTYQGCNIHVRIADCDSVKIKKRIIAE